MTQSNRIPQKQQAMSNGYSSAPPTISGRKIPDFQLNKFIALPPGFKIRSNNADQDSVSARKPVPIKAVPLGLDGHTPVTTDYNEEINSFFSQSEQHTGVISHRRTDSISSIDSAAGSDFSDVSLDSFASGSQRCGRYRKRSQSTPPDIGRQRASPVDRKIEQKIKTEYNQILNQIQKGNLNPKKSSISSGNQNGFCAIQDRDDNDSRTSLDSLDLNDSTDWDVTFSHQSVPITGNHLGHNPTGQTTNIMHPQYLTLPRNFQATTGSGRELKMDRPMSSVYTNGSPYHSNGIVVYKPLSTGEFIMVGNNSDENRGRAPSERSVENHKNSLYKSRGLSSSMPTLLGTNSKADKKLLKEIKRREKEERKLIEKEEKRRREEEKRLIQEEKKRRKSILKEQKKLEKLGSKNRTLPKNWAYVNKPIHNVYQKPSGHQRPKLSLSAVPIDFEDGPAPAQRTVPPNKPPPPPPQFMFQGDTVAKALYASAPDLQRLEQVYGATIRGPSQHTRKYNVPKGPVYVVNKIPSNFVSDYAPRTVVLQKGPEGYGFILRGAKSQSTRNGELDFHPTPEFPALQYLDNVDPGSRADRVGLKPGDFILEINGENVVRASHDRVVQIIRHSGDTLAMKVVTVQQQQTPVNWQHMDGTMTLPTRGTSNVPNKKQAPQPPRRDPRTSLSKEKGRQIAEGLNELDQLDLALAEFEKETIANHPQVTSEQKTASIRGKHAAKRVSCVDLSNIENNDSDRNDYRGPSERLVHKYSNDRKLSAMERSQSTPDLSDKKPEPVYATPVVPGSVGVQRKNSSGNVYATPEDNISVKSGMLTTERPKGPPPPPPGGGKRPAPSLPKDHDVQHSSKTEVVSINTTGSRTSLYARPEKAVQNDDFESSFKPGASAKMTDEPKIKSKAHQRNSSLTSNNSTGSRNSDDKHSVSFAEDKILDNAKSYLQKHPNAKLLVTADIHSNKSQSASYEPEPDYDIEEEKIKSKVTVISVGERKMNESEIKKYSVRSDIPTGNIPPPPSEPAPQPPTKSKSMAPQPNFVKSSSPQVSPAKSVAPKPPSPKSPSPKIEPEVQQKEDPKVDKMVSVPPAPPMPPTAPPPPPAPPVPPAGPPPPLPKSEPPVLVKTEAKPMSPNNTTPQGVQASDLLAAVQKRQQRMDLEGPKISALPQSKDGPPKDDNQAAIIAAVARRRRMLEEKGETSIIDTIESKLQKTKKLQSAKLAFSSDTIGKTSETIPKVERPVELKTIGIPSTKTPVEKQAPKVDAKTIAVKQEAKLEVKSAAALPPKVDLKLIKDITVKGKEPTKIMSTINDSSDKASSSLSNSSPKSSVSKESDKCAPVKTDIKENAQMSPRSTNYVAMAEKARQAYLQKKASQSTINVSATNNTAKTKQGDRAKSPAKNTPPLKTEVPAKDQNKNIISIGNERNKIFSSVTQIPNGNAKNTTKNIEGEVIPLKSVSDRQSTSSIKDRIASINRLEDNKANGKHIRDKVDIKGVTMNSSVTDKASVPPPLEFGDSVQVEIIPPPTGFDGGSNFSDISRQSSVFNQEDNESLVSSVSTLSNLSDEQADSGYGRQRHNYEELIAPPPPEFGDTSSNQGYDAIPSVIPPPPAFVEEKDNLKQVSKPFSSKIIDNWQCLDVLDWLDSLKLSQYKTSFQQKCIDGKRLQNLSRNDYIDLGVTQVGHRMNLERSIKKLNLPKNIVSSSHL